MRRVRTLRCCSQLKASDQLTHRATAALKRFTRGDSGKRVCAGPRGGKREQQFIEEVNEEACELEEGRKKSKKKQHYRTL